MILRGQHESYVVNNKTTCLSDNSSNVFPPLGAILYRVLFDSGTSLRYAAGLTDWYMRCAVDGIDRGRDRVNSKRVPTVVDFSGRA
jgi:hypothetical protein